MTTRYGAGTRECWITESVSIYCFSALAERWQWLFLIYCLKLKNPSTRWQSPFQIWRVGQQNQSFLGRWHGLPFSVDYLRRLLDILYVHLCIPIPLPSFHCALRSPPTSFILTLHFTMPTVSFSLLSKIQLRKAFSLHVGALSLWYSPPQ